MLKLHEKQEVINYLFPLKLWVDNYGAVPYWQTIDDVAEYLEKFDERTIADITRFLEGICKVRQEYKPDIIKINV